MAHAGSSLQALALWHSPESRNLNAHCMGGGAAFPSCSTRRRSLARSACCSIRPASAIKALPASYLSEARSVRRAKRCLRATNNESGKTPSTPATSEEAPNGPPLLTIIAGLFITGLLLWVVVALLQGLYGLITWTLGPASMVK